MIVRNINPLKDDTLQREIIQVFPGSWLTILRRDVDFSSFYEVHSENRREPLLLNAEHNFNMKTIIALV